MSIFGQHQNEHNPNNHTELSGPEDSVQTLSWSPKANFLVAGSWDSQVHCWEVNANGATPKVKQSYGAPVLHSCWSDDGTKVFLGGCDLKAQCWDLASQNLFPVATHEQPVKFVNWIPKSNILMTGSWDKTIKYWDGRQPNPILTVQLPERLYCANVKDNLAVVATAERHVLIYNLAKPNEVYKSFTSPLKFQTRCVSAFPDMTGFALGSIEGRVAIHHIEDDKSNANFAFKCHRVKEQIFAVNDIDFNVHGTFATCGADGTVSFWDKDSKQRLKVFRPCSQPITCCKFNEDASLFAYSSCYDWSKGAGGYQAGNAKTFIFTYAVPGAEVAGRSRKR